MLYLLSDISTLHCNIDGLSIKTAAKINTAARMALPRHAAVATAHELDLIQMSCVTKLKQNLIKGQQQKVLNLDVLENLKSFIFCDFFSSDQSDITHFTSFSMHLPLLALLSLLGRKSHATTSYLVECI